MIQTTQQSLDEFYKWAPVGKTGKSNSLMAIEGAFEYLKTIYNTGYGTIKEDENLISIHTGGWSENEEIIYHFKKTLWWAMYFRAHLTGGHYFFDTKDGDKEWDIIKKDK